MPGLFTTVTPFLAAQPERGRTWISYPGGISRERPVGTIARWPGRSVRGALSWARRSKPLACKLPYVGSSPRKFPSFFTFTAMWQNRQSISTRPDDR